MFRNMCELKNAKSENLMNFAKVALFTKFDFILNIYISVTMIKIEWYILQSIHVACSGIALTRVL